MWKNISKKIKRQTRKDSNTKKQVPIQIWNWLSLTFPYKKSNKKNLKVKKYFNKK